MQRPDFDSIKDYAEFCKYYWYRDELIRICKAHGLKASGSKTELNNVVEAFFSGEKILPEKKSEKKQQVKVKTRKEMVKELTLDTGLLTCGFTFGNRFREFFRQQTGEEHFKFNVNMVASVKAVRETGDESFTLGDLLNIYYGKKTYDVYDKSALQWNKFVKDFCEDEATKIFKERLKAAAVLWKIVRESDMKKEYSHKLLEEYMDSMEDSLHFMNEQDEAGIRQRLYNSRKRRSDEYMHEITYRYATSDDIEGLLQSRMDMLRVVNNLGQDYDFDQEFINSSREYFLNGNQITVLALDGGKIIGCASICFIHVMPTFSHPTGKRAHLMNVYTDAAYQRQGIAYRMTNMLIEAAWEKGATEISLDATVSGRPLYEKCGFKDSDEYMVLVRSE